MLTDYQVAMLCAAIMTTRHKDGFATCLKEVLIGVETVDGKPDSNRNRQVLDEEFDGFEASPR